MMENGEWLLIVLAALAAGIMRGFTGFGGPAFMLAILTIFFAPMFVLSKLFIIDVAANVYLFKSAFRQVNWTTARWLILPTMVALPVGHWILVDADQVTLRRAIALTILLCSVFMLSGLRFKREFSRGTLICIGVVSGIVFGTTYIALLVVAAVLSGPYDKTSARSLIIAWAFAAALLFGVISFATGTTDLDDVLIALPSAAVYLFGAWLGARWFVSSAEHLFRQVALLCLLLLSVCALLL